MKIVAMIKSINHVAFVETKMGIVIARTRKRVNNLTPMKIL